MAGQVFKRWLYLTHRWIGIVTCLLFAMWFASGLVMLYVPYPSLDRSEWVQHQRPIDWAAVETTPEDLALVEGSSALRKLSLEMRGDRPAWRRLGWDGEEAFYSALDGRPFSAPSESEIRGIAAMFAGLPVTRLETIRNDQWTVSGRYDAHRPLWKADLAGEGGRTLYLSSKTGEVLLETTGRERFWNWLGSVPHWIYPTVLRQDNEAWRQVVMWLAGPCIIAAVTGIWIGLLRVRLGKRRFKDGQISPYKGWMWWHHIPGLAGSLFLVLWVFSGWLSVDPGRLFTSKGPELAQRQSYAGLVSGAADWPALSKFTDARRVSITSAAGRAYLRVEAPATADRDLDPVTLAPLGRDDPRILKAVHELYPASTIAGTELLERGDLYWFNTDGPLALPVLRVILDDRAATWLHMG